MGVPAPCTEVPAPNPNSFCEFERQIECNVLPTLINLLPPGYDRARLDHIINLLPPDHIARLKHNLSMEEKKKYEAIKTFVETYVEKLKGTDGKDVPKQENQDVPTEQKDGDVAEQEKKKYEAIKTF